MSLGAVAALSAVHVAASAALRVLALPRLDIPLVSVGNYGPPFGSLSRNLVLVAFLALALAFAALPRGFWRRPLALGVAFAALLAGAFAVRSLTHFSRDVTSVLRALAWAPSPAGALHHPGTLLDIGRALLSGQSAAALGALTLALAALAIRHLPNAAGYAAALRAFVLLLAATAWTYRLALTDESDCFATWPRFNDSVPLAWSGLWVSHAALLCACGIALSGSFAIRRAALGGRAVAPWCALALAFAYAVEGDGFGQALQCQLLDVPERVTDIPALADRGTTDGSGASDLRVQLTPNRWRWDGRVYSGASSYARDLGRYLTLRAQLGQALDHGFERWNATSLVIEAAADVPLAQLSDTVGTAREAQLRGVELAFGTPSSARVAPGFELTGVSVVYATLRFASPCACQLSLGGGGDVTTWLAGPGQRVLGGGCCLPPKRDALEPEPPE